MDYKKAYYMLFNTITDCLEHLDSARTILITAQNETENLYIESENKNILEINRKMMIIYNILFKHLIDF